MHRPPSGQNPGQLPDHEPDEHTHSHSVGSGGPGTRFNWRIHHPYQHAEDRVAVEVAPWQGLTPRWRFVLPAGYEGIVEWGTGDPGGEHGFTPPGSHAAQGGPVEMVNGPTVIWFGSLEALSSKKSAFLVFEGEPPHYVMFGQSETPEGPPGSLEGITFGDHSEHPHDHGPGDQSYEGHDHL